MNRSERALRTSHSLPSCRGRGRGSCRERAVRRWCCGPSTGRRRRRCSTEPCRVPPADVLASRCPVRVRGRAGGRVGDLEPCEGGIADRYGDVESVGFVRVDHGGERIRELLGTIDEAVCSHGVPAGEAEPVAAARGECDGQPPLLEPGTRLGEVAAGAVQVGPGLEARGFVRPAVSTGRSVPRDVELGASAGRSGQDGEPAGAENSVRSCDLHVLVDKTAKPVSSQRADGRAGSLQSAQQGGDVPGRR